MACVEKTWYYGVDFGEKDYSPEVIMSKDKDRVVTIESVDYKVWHNETRSSEE